MSTPTTADRVLIQALALELRIQDNIDGADNADDALHNARALLSALIRDRGWKGFYSTATAYRAEVWGNGTDAAEWLAEHQEVTA